MNNAQSYQNFNSYPNFSSENYNLGYKSNVSMVNGSTNFGGDNRLIGSGFAFPFLLGGVTGAAIAPAFWRPPYNRPYYGPYYGPGFYGPYRPF